MTEDDRKQILNKIVLHMIAQNCGWQQIVNVREMMWQELARYVKVQP